MRSSPGSVTRSPKATSRASLNVPSRATDALDLPVGIVTFVLTDVVGSSRLWEEDPERAKRALTTHHLLIDQAVTRRDGARPREQGEGDSTLSAFGRAQDACAFALDIQESLGRHPDTEGIRIRVAIHTGEAQLMDARNYLAAPVNRCARLRGLAHPGQILLSRTTWELSAGGLDPDVEVKDLGMHRLKDLTRAEHVFQLYRADSRSQFPPLSSLDAFTNNLPVQLTSFVGRDDEVQELIALVPENRLVTLSGPGGCGKTRLSLQVAADVVGEFTDGVWFVELAPVTEPDQVAAEVANALLLQPGPMQSSLDTLRAYLKERNLLIVLDNCEHVVQASAELTNILLRECPRVSLLATSREPLGVPGEVVWRVPSLSNPSAEEVSGSAESLLDFGALRLFMERATQARPDFSIAGSAAPTVAEICRRLDGIPLAIELAAARVRHLPPAGILAALEDHFHVLKGGARTDQPRQRTLEASVDWSYALLSEPERILLDRLSVFWGFTLEEVETVCGFEPLDPQEILDLVGSLVDKSLVQIEDNVLGTRYRLLETIRQFAARRLGERGEAETMCSRHASSFFDLLEKGDKPLEDGNIEWQHRLDNEYDNFRAAVLWALKGGADASSVALHSHPLALLAGLTGRAEETTSWLDEALAMVPDGEAELRATVLHARAVIAGYKLELQVLLPVATEAHSLYVELGNEQMIGRCSILMGFVQTFVGHYESGVALIEQGLATARGLGDKSSMRSGLLALGFCLMIRNPNQARECLEECIQLHSEGVAADLPLAIGFLSRCEIQQGRWQMALETSGKASDLARAHHQRPALANGLACQAEALLNMGRLDEARPLIAEAERTSFEIQSVPGYAYSLSVRCSLELAEGNRAAARDAGMRAVALLSGDALRLGTIHQLSLARAELEDGDLQAGTATLSGVLKKAEAHSLLWPLAAATHLNAWLALREDQLAAAKEMASDALIRFERIDSESGMIEGLELMAEIAFSLERYPVAARLLAASQAHRERTHFVVYPIHQPARDQFVADLHDRLGDSFEDEWNAGLVMDLTEAVNFARMETT